MRKHGHIFARIGADLTAHLQIWVPSVPLNAVERLRILHDFIAPVMRRHFV